MTRLTHYQTTNFRLFETEEFADDNFKFDQNGRKLSIRVESTVGKGEIARYKQFLLFPRCFQKTCFPGVSKGVIVREWVDSTKGQIFRLDKIQSNWRRQMLVKIIISLWIE